MRELAQRVRRAQRATWFPLPGLAAVTFAAIPVYRYGHYAKVCATVGSVPPVGRTRTIYTTAGFVYPAA